MKAKKIKTFPIRVCLQNYRISLACLSRFQITTTKQVQKLQYHFVIVLGHNF